METPKPKKGQKIAILTFDVAHPRSSDFGLDDLPLIPTRIETVLFSRGKKAWIAKPKGMSTATLFTVDPEKVAAAEAFLAGDEAAWRAIQEAELNRKSAPAYVLPRQLPKVTRERWEKMPVERLQQISAWLTEIPEEEDE